jgi:hypothetical protein
METFLTLIIEAVIYVAVLFLVPMLVAKTFLRNHVSKAALGVVMAVLLGLAVISLTVGITAALVEPLQKNGSTTTMPFQSRMMTNPLNLDIQSR